MTSPFAIASVDLGALGYSCLPLIPPSVSHHKGRGKAPGAYVSGGWRGLDKWQRFKDTSPSEFDLGMWNRAPNANIGLILGTRAGTDLHVIAIDIDVVDQDAFDTLLRCLPHSPMRKCGAKGLTAFYRAPKTVKTKCYDDARIARDSGQPRRLVDLLTGFDTRQTVVPPSVHPDGPIYRWLDGPVAPDALPIFDEDALEKLEDTLRTLGWNPEAPSSSGIDRKPRDPNREIDPDDIWSETKAAALGNLDAWVPALNLYGLRPARGGYEAVATWRASCSGRNIADRKRNLSIQRDGIKDFGTNDTYSAIDLVMSVKDCEQAEATDWLRVQLGLKDDGVVIALGSMGISAEVDHDLPEPLRVKAPDNRPDVAVIAAPEPQVSVCGQLEAANGDLPDHLTRVPGLVGELTDWIADSARKPQRAGALLAAIELVGTAAGRKYAGPTMTGTHIYGLFLAPSGAAKDHPLKCIGRVLHACTMGAHFGPSGFMSMSALINRISRQPLTLTCIDEFGSFLGRINGRKASTHEKAITGVLRTAWGSSFDTMAPPEWAGRVGEPIHSPALSIYGVSTHEEFFQNLEGGDVFNGFLNRFLILSTHTRVTEREPSADKMVVPPSVVDGMLAIYTSGNPLTRATSHSGMADAPMVVVPWDDQFAQGAYRACGEAIERMDSDAVFYTRTAEMAQRLATIRAIGINPTSPRVTLADMDWGVAVAMWSARRMVSDAESYMADSDYTRLEQKVLRAVRARPLAKRDLSRAVRVEGRQLDAMLKDMLEREQLVETKVAAGPSGGRPRSVYALSD